MREVIEKTWGWNEEWQRTDFERRFRQYLASVIEYQRRPIGGLLLVLCHVNSFTTAFNWRMLRACGKQPMRWR
jgi:hypothetical protein